MSDFDDKLETTPESSGDDWMVGVAGSVGPSQPDQRISSALVMVETAFLSTTTALIWLVNAYVPLGPVLRMFFALPIALTYLRWGNRAAWMTAVVSGLLLSVLLGPPRSIQFFLPYGLLGVVLGHCWKKGVGWGVSMFWGILISALGLVLQIGLLSILLATNVWLYLNQQVTGILEWVFVKLNVLIDPSLWLVQIFALGLIFVNATLYLLLVHLVASVLFERLNYPIPDPPEWLQVLLDEP